MSFMIPEKNSLYIGIFWSILLPLAVFLMLYGVFAAIEHLGWVSSQGFRPKFRERTCGIIAIAANAYLLNIWQKRYLTQAVRGVVIMTVLWIALWLLLFGKYVL